LLQFYTTDPSTCPDPTLNLPNFSFFIFGSIGDLTGLAATFLGYYLFENYFHDWNAQRAFWLTTALTVVGALFDIMNTTRANQWLLGWTGLGEVRVSISSREVRLDDLCSFVFGTSFLSDMVDTLDQLPYTVMISKLAPRGVEATVFAIVIGCSTIGLTLSGQIGGVVISRLGFNFRRGNSETPSVCDLGGSQETNGNPASFHGLAQALVIGNIILPLLTIPLTWCLIPNQRLSDDFLGEGLGEREVELQGLGERELECPGGPQTVADQGMSAQPTGQSRSSIDTLAFRTRRGTAGGNGLL